MIEGGLQGEVGGKQGMGPMMTQMWPESRIAKSRTMCGCDPTLLPAGSRRTPACVNEPPAGHQQKRQPEGCPFCW